MIGLFGGAFDPPHRGHVALLATAREVFGLDEIVVVVAGDPAHKPVETPANERLALAQAAFPGETVVLDGHGRTVDMLHDHPEWAGSRFLIGADEFAGFLRWKEPAEVLRLVTIGVATRPGVAREQLEAVADALGARDRVAFFELEPLPIASRDLRASIERGDDVSGLVPPAVWQQIERAGLYGRSERPSA